LEILKIAFGSGLSSLLVEVVSSRSKPSGPGGVAFVRLIGTASFRLPEGRPSFPDARRLSLSLF
jgi:hypothetical protein